MAYLHPLANLTFAETSTARDIIRASHEDTVIEFREIGLKEPPKAELVKFLEIEHSGALTDSTSRPPRLAYAHFDTIGADKVPHYCEALIDLPSKTLLTKEIISKQYHPALTM